MLIAGVALWASPTIASAHAGNDDPNVVHVCIGNVSEIVSIVGVSGSCISPPPLMAKTPAHRAVQGPPGINGTDGTNGTNGTNGIDGTGARAAGPCFDNTKRYVDCGNGTVTDTVTGLIWLKQADCLSEANWKEANQAAAGLKAGDCRLTDGSSPGDWRLPTKAEWEATIARAVALGCTFGHAPSLTNDAGTACYGDGTGSSRVGVASVGYWSSTLTEPNPLLTIFPNSSVVSFANLHHGDVISIESVVSLGVWPVRGGPR